MPLLTLTSDIGQRDYLAGAVKGQLLKINPGFTIIDISHSLPPFNYPLAAYVCRNAIKNFPEHTFHFILVNLFQKKTGHLLLAFHDKQYILCADNGLLTMILEQKPEMVVGIPLDMKKEMNTINFITAMGNAVNRLLKGESIKDIGIPDVNYQEINPLKPVLDDKSIEGQVIFIDNFENVIVNITREEFEKQGKNRKFRIEFIRDEIIDQISDTYSDVPEGEKLALFNSAGYLEIAINKGNAAGLFGLKGFSGIPSGEDTGLLQNQLIYRTVRVYFD
jgi:S-adenosylmethionine hydrolase